MGKKYIIEEVEDGGGCLSVLGFIAAVFVVLMMCAALAK